MKKKIILAVVLAALILAGGCSSEVPETKAPPAETNEIVSSEADQTEEPVEEESVIEITDDIYSDKTDYAEGVCAEIYITAPKAIAPQYGESVDLFNQIVEMNTDALKNEYLQDVEFNKDSEGAYSSSRMMTYETYFADDGLISVLLNTTLQLGGVSRSSRVGTSINFDLRNGQEITLESLINCDVDVLKEKILNKMRENPEIYYSTEDDALDSIDISRSFLFDDEKVYIFFDDYMIAPRSAGFQIFEFSYNELS